MRNLRNFTSARVGLSTAGDSVGIEPLLDFRLAHARARDAVHFPLDSASLMQEMAQHGWPCGAVYSKAENRQDYLQRPDKGRLLDSASAAEVRPANPPSTLVFVVADGLSPLAVHRHAVPLLELVFRHLQFVPDEANPVWIARQARVALADHIGELLDASLSVILIGERPGWSTPDSLGVYVTWQPRRGRSDADRNCISNIHAAGLSYEEAAHKLLFLVQESLRRRVSGVSLKEAAGRFLREPKV